MTGENPNGCSLLGRNYTTLTKNVDNLISFKLERAFIGINIQENNHKETEI